MSDMIEILITPQSYVIYSGHRGTSGHTCIPLLKLSIRFFSNFFVTQAVYLHYKWSTEWLIDWLICPIKRW